MRPQEQLEAAKIISAADVVFTHFGEDTHRDHRNIARAVVPAARSVQSLLYFEGYPSQSFNPTVFGSVGKVIQKKLGPLEARASQAEKTNIANMSIIHVAQSMGNFRDIQGRVTYAEGFVPFRYSLNI